MGLAGPGVGNGDTGGVASRTTTIGCGGIGDEGGSIGTGGEGGGTDAGAGVEGCDGASIGSRLDAIGKIFAASGARAAINGKPTGFPKPS